MVALVVPAPRVASSPRDDGPAADTPGSRLHWAQLAEGQAS